MTSRIHDMSRFFLELAKKQRLVIPAAALLFAVLIFAGISAGNFFGERSYRTSELQRFANEVTAKCRAERYPPGCYDEEIPKLMDTHLLSLQQAFEVTKLVQANDPDYWYCHVLGHNISAKEVSRDPSRWKDVIAQCPSGMCSNGCIHGGFQERFRTDSLTDEEVDALKPELATICEEREGWRPTGLEQASCYHALGHLIMYLTSADIRKSTALCEEIAVKPGGRDLTQVCFEGAFMQIFQPLEPEDFGLVKDIAPQTREAAALFCAAYSGEKQAACWRESWPLSLEEVKTPAGLVSFCSVWNDARLQHKCYNALFYVLTAQFRFDESKIVGLCSGLPDERRGQCFANAASRLIETDYRLIERSINLCKTAARYGKAADCWDELAFYATFNYHPGSLESRELCNRLPSPWKDRCLTSG